MIMKTIKQYTIPAKPKLVMLTAMAIAVLFSLPRLAVLRHLQNNAADPRIFEFLIRTLYAFVVAAAFLLLNLQQQRIKLRIFCI